VVKKNLLLDPPVAAMPAAKSLADLMRIRAHPPNRDYLDSINGHLGTALGFKRRSGESLSDVPCVVVFVPEKIHRKWLRSDQRIKTELRGPGNLHCPLDVIAGSKAIQEQPVPASGSALAQRLRGLDERIWCGSQISSFQGPTVVYGCLGAFVRANADSRLGFLTNDHVAIGPAVYHPWAPGSPKFPGGTALIGARQRTLVEMPAVDWYGDCAAEANNIQAAVRVDCAFVSTSLAPEDFVPEPLVDERFLRPGPWGRVLEIDVEADMNDPRTSIIGRDVYHVGPRTGLRRGRIEAFAYEWRDQPGEKRFADLLISGETQPIGTGIELSLPFSYKGDSGSVIFTQVDHERRPVALLWGGWQEQLRGGASQENWSYATRLDRILSALDVSLVAE
jgi:hypothetical protein